MWKWIAIGIAFGAVYVVADRKATYRERAACEAAAQRAQRAADAQDAKAERELRLKAEATVGELSTQKVNDDAILEHLKVQLAKRPLSAPCYYPDVAPTGRVRSRPASKGAGN
jgi:flagellar biosynthesis/type III secretory pathway M-ring protein FliF/YscJ